jgi:hypothetical protein
MDTEQFVGHTEGPWDFELYGDEGTIFAPSKMIQMMRDTGEQIGREELSICGLHNLNQTGEQMVSNGMLMAASPELLERVKELEKELAEEKENFRLFRDSVVKPVLKHVYSKEEEHKKFQVMIHALRCAQADLQGILPEFEPGGDREHSGWQTLDELNELLAPFDN